MAVQLKEIDFLNDKNVEFYDSKLNAVLFYNEFQK